MKISIIIPAYDDAIGVLMCLNSLRGLAANRENIEWIVQDDCSPNVHLPAVVPPEVAYTFRNAANVGFGGNCNAGAAQASGDVLMFVNQDVYGVYGWSDRWDEAITAAFDAPSVGIVGARLLFPNGSVQNAGGLFDAKCQPYHRCLGYSNPHVEEVSTPREVSWTTGAAFAVRRDTWLDVGGFDPAYGRGYFEDVAFCTRALMHGWSTWYEPRATFIHKVGGTGGNPRFMENARLFKRQFVDSGFVRPDTSATQVRFW